ncbi:MAG: acyl carrier protein [Desulfobacterales bacterium]|nr:acyl carrier protein [Desulfobacterales bacterium]
MEFDNVYGKVKQVVAEVFSTDESELTMETSIIDDLGAESLDIITLLMEFEDMFDQKIPDEDVQKFLTIGDIVKYIMNLAGKTS